MPSLKEKSQRRLSRFEWVLLAFIAMQFLMICYVNLTQLRLLTGYDSSLSYLLTRKMWEQKTLFPSGFSHMRTYGWSSPVVPAYFLCYLTHDVFLSSGIVNILFVLLLIGSFALLLRELGLRGKFALLSVIFLLTPYTASYATDNALDYLSMTCINYCPYTSRLIFLFLITVVYLRLQKKERKKSTWVLLGVSLLLSFLMGMCAGISTLLLFIAPFLLHALIRFFAKNDFSELKTSASIYSYILAAVMFCGTLFASGIMHFTSRSEGIVWVNADELLDNFRGMLGGYFSLTSALPFQSEVPVSGKMGLAFGVLLCIALFLMISSFYEARKALKTKDVSHPYFPVILLVFVNLFVFLFADLRLSTSMTESRYFIPVLVSFFLLACSFLQDLLSETKTILKKVILPAIVLALAFSNALSYYSLFHHRLDENKYTRISDLVSTTGTDLVYSYGSKVSSDSRILRVMDPDHVYHQIGEDVSFIESAADSTEYATADTYPGGVCLITTLQDFELLPTAVSDSYKLIGETDGYAIYYADKNVLSDDYLASDKDGYVPVIRVVEDAAYAK